MYASKLTRHVFECLKSILIVLMIFCNNDDKYSCVFTIHIIIRIIAGNKIIWFSCVHYNSILPDEKASLCYTLYMSTIVLAISGSSRKGSITMKLIRAFEQLAPRNIEFRIADLSTLPLYNQDLELPEPDFLKNFKKQIKNVDAILFVTPEYNRSYPPLLKNALDWASRPPSTVEEKTWYGKPAAIAGMSPHSLGAFGAVQHLRQVLTNLNMPTMQQPEFYLTNASEKFDINDILIDEVTKEQIHKFWSEFVVFIHRFKH